MAAYYVWSGAVGSGTGASWANAYTFLQTAMTGKAAGDIFYVAHDHAESAAGSITIPNVGSVSNPVKVVCVSRSGSVPPVVADLRTTATCTSTGAHVGSLGYHYVYGVRFVSTVAGGFLVDGHYMQGRWDNCAFTLFNNLEMTGGPGPTDYGNYTEFYNTTVTFTAPTLNVGCNAGRWRNTPAAFPPSSNAASGMLVMDHGWFDLQGVDISRAVGNLVFTQGDPSFSNAAVYRLLDCKIANVDPFLSGAPLAFGINEVSLVGAHLTQPFVIDMINPAGRLFTETTIVRTPGASDGTTAFSWKVVTTGSNWITPFECPPIAFWNDTVGSPITLTVQGIWGGAAVPSNREIWLEVQYLGDATAPLSATATGGVADYLAVCSLLPDGSGTWGGSTTKFVMPCSFTPQQKGWVYARVKCAKASTTFYIDPMVTVGDIPALSPTEAFLARTSGLDATHINAYTALIDGLVADGVWAKLDVLRVYATQNAATALLNLVRSSYAGIATNSPTFTVDRGYTGVDGAFGALGECIQSQFIPSLAQCSNYALTSAHISVFNLTNTQTQRFPIGADNGGKTGIHTRFTDGNAYFYINGSNTTPGVAVARADGHYVSNRSGGTIEGYKNGSLITSFADGTGALHAVQFIDLAMNVSGTTTAGEAHQIASTSIGSSLTAGEASALNTRLRTYLAAVGVTLPP